MFLTTTSLALSGGAYGHQTSFFLQSEWTSLFNNICCLHVHVRYERGPGVSASVSVWEWLAGQCLLISAAGPVLDHYRAGLEWAGELRLVWSATPSLDPLYTPLQYNSKQPRWSTTISGKTLIIILGTALRGTVRSEVVAAVYHN